VKELGAPVKDVKARKYYENVSEAPNGAEERSVVFRVVEPFEAAVYNSMSLSTEYLFKQSGKDFPINRVINSPTLTDVHSSGAKLYVRAIGRMSESETVITQLTFTTSALPPSRPQPKKGGAARPATCYNDFLLPGPLENEPDFLFTNVRLPHKFPVSKTNGELASAVMKSIVRIDFISDSASTFGTGFVIDGRGYILTNYHVVAGGIDPETIELADPKSGKGFAEFRWGDNEAVSTRATIVGIDASSDLALLKVDPDCSKVQAVKTKLLDEDGHFSYLSFAYGASVGEEVVAIGFAQGFSGYPTVSEGIVSGMFRSYQTDPGVSFAGMIQTDAAINHGNSGGPLVNRYREVVGINTMHDNATYQGKYPSGISFARSYLTCAEIANRLLHLHEKEPNNKKLAKIHRAGLPGITHYLDPTVELRHNSDEYQRRLLLLHHAIPKICSGDTNGFMVLVKTPGDSVAHSKVLWDDPCESSSDVGIKQGDVIDIIDSGEKRYQIKTLSELNDALVFVRPNSEGWIHFVRVGNNESMALVDFLVNISIDDTKSDKYSYDKIIKWSEGLTSGWVRVKFSGSTSSP
jgi:S1-C subfamily serine protease